MEEGVGRMSASIPWVFQFASEGVERCSHMTGGWGFNGLIKSVQVSWSVVVVGCGDGEVAEFSDTTREFAVLGNPPVEAVVL